MAAVITTRRTAGLSLLWRQRGLVWAMAKRELVDRYARLDARLVLGDRAPAAVDGGLSVRVRLTSFVCGSAGPSEMPRDYTVYLLSGIVPWLALSEALNKASVSVTSNANLVKQVCLPARGAAWSRASWRRILTQSTGLAVLTVYSSVTDRSLPATYRVVTDCARAASGHDDRGGLDARVGWGVRAAISRTSCRSSPSLAPISVPVFDLLVMVPESFRPPLYLNPFTYLIWCWQDVCYYGRIEHPGAWLVATADRDGGLHSGLADVQASQAAVRERAVTHRPRGASVRRTVPCGAWARARGCCTSATLPTTPTSTRRSSTATASTATPSATTTTTSWAARSGRRVSTVPSPIISGPDWTAVDLKGYQRPRWFAQGPREYCIQYSDRQAIRPGGRVRTSVEPTGLVQQDAVRVGAGPQRPCVAGDAAEERLEAVAASAAAGARAARRLPAGVSESPEVGRRSR